MGFFSCFIALFLVLHQIKMNHSNTGIVNLNLSLLFQCHRGHFGSSKPAPQQLKLQYHLVHWIKFKSFPCSISKVVFLKLCVEKALSNPVCKYPKKRPHKPDACSVTSFCNYCYCSSFSCKRFYKKTWHPIWQVRMKQHNLAA